MKLSNVQCLVFNHTQMLPLSLNSPFFHSTFLVTILKKTYNNNYSRIETRHNGGKRNIKTNKNWFIEVVINAVKSDILSLFDIETASNGNNLFKKTFESDFKNSILKILSDSNKNL